MKKRSLSVKLIVIANALLITTAFVGCPARKDPAIGIVPAPIAAYREPPFVTIAPPPVEDKLLWNQPPPPPSQDPKNEKRNP
jgi:hypothetical protein